MSVPNHASLKLLGGFRLQSPSGEALVLQLRKSEAFLAYLACQPSCSATREQIANLLWGDYAQPRARQSLRQALLDIKKVFANVGLEPLRIGRELISLDERALTADVQGFEAMIKEGTAQSLRGAIDLFDGEFLAGLNIRSSDFDGWLLAHRNRFQDLYIRATAEYMALIGESEPEAAIAVGKRALAHDPTREELHRALIGLYARGGLQSAAIAQYRQCAAILEREFGIGPDEETLKLVERITQHDRGPVRIRPLKTSPVDAFAAEDEPADHPVAIGRATELASLEDEIKKLSQGLGRIVVMRGEQGVGKRHLYLCLMAEHPDGAMQISVREQGPATQFPWHDLIGLIVNKALDLPEQALAAEGSDALALLRDGIPGAQGARVLGAEARPVTTEVKDAAATLVRILSRRLTMVIAFEGLHRLDRAHLEQAFLWIRRIVNYPVLVLVSVPHGDVPLSVGFDMRLSLFLGEPHCRLLELSPLSEEETEALGRDLLSRLGLKPIRHAQLEWIWHISQGNPRVAIALAMDLLARDGNIPDHESYLPVEVEGEVRARVSGLSQAGQEILSLAAVHGERLGLALLAQAAGCSPGDFAASIDELIGASLLDVSNEEVRFRHRRVRYAVLNATSAPRRHAFHGAMAEACELMDGRERILRSDAIARHLAGSGKPQEAAEFRLTAGDLAFRRGALDEAAECFESVAATFAPKEMSRSAHLQALTLRARLGLVRIAEWRRRFAAALDGAGAVVQAAEGPGLRDVKAAAEVCRARALFALGDPDSAVRAARRAERLAEGWHGAGAWLAPDIFLARRRLCRSYVARLIPAVRAAHGDALDEGLALDVIETRGVLAVLLMDDHYTEAAAELDAAREEAGDLGNARYEALLDYLDGLALMAHDRPTQAAQLFERGLAVAGAAGDLYRHYMLEGELALLAAPWRAGHDVKLQRVALLESTLGSQSAAARIAAQMVASGDGEQRLLSETLQAAMRLNDADGFRTVLDLAVAPEGADPKAAERREP
jgi:DNA-binding SARP family transcriptional activator